MWIRGLALSLGLAAVVASLAGCTVPPTGLLALTRAEDGSMRADVWMCSGHTNEVDIYIDDSRWRTWRLVPAVTSTGSVALDGLEEWLLPGQQYHSYAASDDNKHSASGPAFTKADVDSLRPGQSLVIIVDPQQWRDGVLKTADVGADARRSCDQ